MMIRVARIEAHSTPRTTRAEVQGSLFGAAPVARVIWELPGPRETWWLVQVPEELATDQLRRFAHLRITADVVGFRSVEMLDGKGNRSQGVESGLRRFPFRPVCWPLRWPNMRLLDDAAFPQSSYVAEVAHAEGRG
jgi:hypothetical protein